MFASSKRSRGGRAFLRRGLASERGFAPSRPDVFAAPLGFAFSVLRRSLFLASPQRYRIASRRCFSSRTSFLWLRARLQGAFEFSEFGHVADRPEPSGFPVHDADFGSENQAGRRPRLQGGARDASRL